MVAVLIEAGSAAGCRAPYGTAGWWQQSDHLQNNFGRSLRYAGERSFELTMGMLIRQVRYTAHNYERHVVHAANQGGCRAFHVDAVTTETLTQRKAASCVGDRLVPRQDEAQMTRSAGH